MCLEREKKDPFSWMLYCISECTQLINKHHHKLKKILTIFGQNSTQGFRQRTHTVQTAALVSSPCAVRTDLLSVATKKGTAALQMLNEGVGVSRASTPRYFPAACSFQFQALLQREGWQERLHGFFIAVFRPCQKWIVAPWGTAVRKLSLPLIQSRASPFSLFVLL